jgi:3',5'-cyclic-AMP phosphodiesterase
MNPLPLTSAKLPRPRRDYEFIVPCTKRKAREYPPTMPGLYYQPIRRREFLKTSFLVGAAVVFPGGRISEAAAEDEVHLALLSDTHVAGDRERGKDPRGFDPWENLNRVVPEIITRKPRGVILNGDAASREGLVADYEEIKALVEPLSRVTPVYIGLGNHDHRENFNQVFTSAPGLNADVRNHHVLVIEESFLRFIVLDSLFYVAKAAGLLGQHQRWWLTEYLKTHTDKPVVLFVHHTLGEGDGDLLDADRLFGIIRPNPQVKAIFYGHSHMWNISERQGVKLINLPALGYNFGEDQPVGWADARFRRDGVDLTLHAIAGNRAQDGQISRVLWT